MTSRKMAVVAVVVVAVLVVTGVLAFLYLRPAASSPSSSPGVAVCGSPLSAGSGADWPTYHMDNTRTGAPTWGTVTGAKAGWAAPVSLDGPVYAEPLECGNAVLVATEENTVYALNASSGAVLWSHHLGTPVAASSLPCGDIGPSTGITGTPVLDTTTGTLYVVAFESPATHVLYGLNVRNGTVVRQVTVDPPGVSPTAEQQRGALALANGRVYVPYGGLYGDCAQYHGYVVGVPTSSSGSVISYQVPTSREGGIWAPGGISVAANGSLFVSTGNGASTTAFDYGNSVIELSPSLQVQDYFAPTNWEPLNAGDTDLGSVAPTLLPNGDVFQIGKAGVGYLLSATHLGGIGGEITNASICGGGYGGTAHVGLSILVPCQDGLYDVVAGASNLTAAWSATGFDAGSPIVTGNIVWVVDIGSATLRGLNLTDGTQVYSFALGGAEHFISPTAGPDGVVVAGGNEVYSFALS